MGSNTMNGMFGVKIQSSRWDFCFILFAPGDESPGYCHRCPLMGHQNRFKLALMPLAASLEGPLSELECSPSRKLARRGERVPAAPGAKRGERVRGK